MVLNAVAAVWSDYFPTAYIVHIAVAIVVLLTLRLYAQGRKTTRERDLHARKILITGGFTPTGATILQALAERGAHIVALTADQVESPHISLLIDALRATTQNDEIYAEQCDLDSPASIQEFSTRFLKQQDHRLDALIFTHEYRHIGALIPPYLSRDDDQKRRQQSLATFLMTTLLLPSLLTAPVERDIRIINVVNRFYAAATAASPLQVSFDYKSSSVFLSEGIRSLRTVILTRHLQRILDALPAAQIPKTDASTSGIPVADAKAQKSNIVAISVSPGLSRADTVSPVLNADWTEKMSWTGFVLYLLLQPFLRIFTKSSTSVIQSILHVLFLPTPFKVASKGVASEEVLKPGAFYAECAVVKLKVPQPKALEEKEKVEGKEREKGKGKEEEAVMDLPDDGELGGELAGRLVWEQFEDALKDWQKANPPPAQDELSKPADTSG